MIRVRWLPKVKGALVSREKFLEGPYHVEIRDDGTVELYKHGPFGAEGSPRGASAEQIGPEDRWDRVVIEEVS